MGEAELKRGFSLPSFGIRGSNEARNQEQRARGYGKALEGSLLHSLSSFFYCPSSPSSTFLFPVDITQYLFTHPDSSLV